VEVFAFPAIRAATTGEEETAVFVAGGVSAGYTGVAFDVAAGLGFDFAVERERGSVRSWRSDWCTYLE